MASIRPKFNKVVRGFSFNEPRGDEPRKAALRLPPLSYDVDSPLSPTITIVTPASTLDGRPLVLGEPVDSTGRGRRQAKSSLTRFPFPTQLDLTSSICHITDQLSLLVGVAESKIAFLATHPQYHATTHLDLIRQRYYRRLDDSGQVYLDYTGGSLYPSHLIDWHHTLLNGHVFGNPHSDSPASGLSTAHETAARESILAFLDADANDYDVIFTPNATGGLKIVADNYAFAGKQFVTAMDAHNSVNGIARAALEAGASVQQIGLHEAHSTVDEVELTAILQKASTARPGLVFFTGQSNITGAKAKPWWYALARAHGWHVGLDASALAPSTKISLRSHPVDFLVLSVYKIVGYPTGIGALVIAKTSYGALARQTFTGGTIRAIDLPTLQFRLHENHAGYEDGTINYLGLPAVVEGLKFIQPLLDAVSWRCHALVEYLWTTLPTIKYDDHHATSLIEIRGPPPGLERGATLALLFYKPREMQTLDSHRFIVWAAARQKISVRGATCLCNPGASSSVLREKGFEDWLQVGLSELGIIRVSLGVASNFEDCYKFVTFCQQLATLSFYDAERQAWDHCLREAKIQRG